MRHILHIAFRSIHSYFTGETLAWREAVIRSYGAEW